VEDPASITRDCCADSRVFNRRPVSSEMTMDFFALTALDHGLTLVHFSNVSRIYGLHASTVRLDENACRGL